MTRLSVMEFTPDGHLCPACGGPPVVNFNTHPDTRKQKFWTSDSQSITSKCCDTRLIRNGAYGAPLGQSDWKISLDCPCGVSMHRSSDVCSYRPVRRDGDGS